VPMYYHHLRVRVWTVSRHTTVPSGCCVAIAELWAGLILPLRGLGVLFFLLPITGGFLIVSYNNH